MVCVFRIIRHRSIDHTDHYLVDEMIHYFIASCILTSIWCFCRAFRDLVMEDDKSQRVAALLTGLILGGGFATLAGFLNTFVK